MKTILLFCALGLAAVGCQSSGQNKPAGMIHFDHTSVSQVLDVYSRLTGLKLVEDTSLKTLGCCSTLVISTQKPVTKPQAVKLLEKALREQAGIIITPLDAQSASVTYNPALILTNPLQIPRRIHD